MESGAGAVEEDRVALEQNFVDKAGSLALDKRYSEDKCFANVNKK